MKSVEEEEIILEKKFETLFLNCSLIELKFLMVLINPQLFNLQL